MINEPGWTAAGWSQYAGTVRNAYERCAMDSTYAAGLYEGVIMDGAV